MPLMNLNQAALHIDLGSAGTGLNSLSPKSAVTVKSGSPTQELSLSFFTTSRRGLIRVPIS